MGGIEEGISEHRVVWRATNEKGHGRGRARQKELRVIAVDSDRSRAEPFCDDANPDPAPG